MGRLRGSFARRRRVIAYDRRGFTPAAPELAENMRANADDAHLVLERAKAVPADIVGWSAGGRVALALAIEHPSTVRSLTLVEPSLHVAAEEGQETTLAYPRRGAIAEIGCPITIVVGELSQGYFHRVTSYLERLKPRSEVIRVQGVSHAVHLDAAEDLAVAGDDARALHLRFALRMDLASPPK